jgi:putative sterol carrier protein
MPPAFTASWADAWCAALNTSETYRAAAVKWEGSVALVVRTAPDQEPRNAVFLDLEPGACRGARLASADDLAAAVFVFEGAPAVWREVLAGRVSPVMALMSGRLRLARGELARLLPYAAAAKELLVLAGAVDTTFPEEWEA